MNTVRHGRAPVQSIRSARSGFTLIEVMIACAVVALIAAIAYPSYQDQIRRVRRTAAQAALFKTMQEQERYFTRYGSYFAFDQDTAMNHLPFRAYSSDTASSSYYAITAQPCGAGAREGIDACVLLTATPGAAGGPPFVDAECTGISLASNGIRTSTGTGGERCWR